MSIKRKTDADIYHVQGDDLEPFLFLHQIIDPKEPRPFLRTVLVKDSIAAASDGHRLHWIAVPESIPDGQYHFKRRGSRAATLTRTMRDHLVPKSFWGTVQLARAEQLTSTGIALLTETVSGAIAQNAVTILEQLPEHFHPEHCINPVYLLDALRLQMDEVLLTPPPPPEGGTPRDMVILRSRSAGAAIMSMRRSKRK